MVWQNLQRIRERSPLILNITNYVVMNTTANALLALGASPVMAHAVEEIEEMTELAEALVINIGTLSTPWIDAMLKAGKVAGRKGIPIVLDPVGCGATSFRTRTAQRLVAELGPAIIRGNASEIHALVQVGGRTRGVDSMETPDEVWDAASMLSASANCVVSVSGPVDLVVGSGDCARIANGVALMTKVTGMGCTASAITGAFAAVTDSVFEAAVNAMATTGVAGEIASSRAEGPGSFQMHFLDALHNLGERGLTERVRVTRT